jgi:RNA polymerase sigma-70 factor (ECF subfamily)
MGMLASSADFELIQRGSQGDAAAFEILVRRWEQPVSRMLARFVGGRTGGSSSDVEDLTQEVFLRVLAASGRYQNSGAFSTWLFRIALNISRDAARRRNRRQDTLRKRPIEQIAVTPSETASQKEIDEHVSDILNRLPDKLCEPLVLKHEGELTFAEVADVLNVPVGTVKSRVTTALLKLRAELKGRGIDETELQP